MIYKGHKLDIGITQDYIDTNRTIFFITFKISDIINGQTFSVQCKCNQQSEFLDLEVLLDKLCKKQEIKISKYGKLDTFRGMG